MYLDSDLPLHNFRMFQSLVYRDNSYKAILHKLYIASQGLPFDILQVWKNAFG